MRTTYTFVAFIMVGLLGPLSSAFAFPYFILQKPSGNLAVVDGLSSYSYPMVGGPYNSASEARSKLSNLKHSGDAYASNYLRDEREKLAASVPKREPKEQLAPEYEGPVSLASLGTRSAEYTVPLATLPLKDLSDRFYTEELAPVAPLYSSMPPFPELGMFELSQFPGAIGPSPLTPIPLPQSTIASIPNFPQPAFSVPQIQVPLAPIPGLPVPVFTSPLPLAIGFR